MLDLITHLVSFWLGIIFVHLVRRYFRRQMNKLQAYAETLKKKP